MNSVLFRRYYELTKPGMVYGNVLPALTGYFLGYAQSFSIARLVGFVIGLSCVMGSSCVVNNIVDRERDMIMKRTARRVLPRHAIRVDHARVFAGLLASIGFIILGATAGWQATFVAGTAWLLYAGVYTWPKPKTPYATLVGAVSGALPPVIGWLAAGNHLGIIALMLFFILFFWQMIHFYAIALRCINDYRRAATPVYPIVFGASRTIWAMRAYGCIYTLLVFLLTVWLWGNSWPTWVIVTTHVVTLWYLLQPATHIASWARRAFFSSLLALCAWSITTSVFVVLV